MIDADVHRQSVRRRWNIVMAGASYDEAVVREHFPRLALEHDLIVRIEELEATNQHLRDHPECDRAHWNGKT